MGCPSSTQNGCVVKVCTQTRLARSRCDDNYNLLDSALTNNQRNASIPRLNINFIAHIH